MWVPLPTATDNAGECRCILEGKVVSLNLYEEHESASFHNSTRKSGHILESRV